MSAPTTNAEARALFLGNKRMEYLVYKALWMMWMERHARDNAERGQRSYCECFWMEDGDVVKAYQRALEMAAMSPED